MENSKRRKVRSIAFTPEQDAFLEKLGKHGEVSKLIQTLLDKHIGECTHEHEDMGQRLARWRELSAEHGRVWMELTQLQSQYADKLPLIKDWEYGHMPHTLDVQVAAENMGVPHEVVERFNELLYQLEHIKHDIAELHLPDEGEEEDKEEAEEEEEF